MRPPVYDAAVEVAARQLHAGPSKDAATAVPTQLSTAGQLTLPTGLLLVCRCNSGAAHAA